MKYDRNKVDEMTLALMYLATHEENELGARAWKGFDWDTMERLHVKGYISSPVGKAKSVVLTLKGLTHSRELFNRHFGQ